MERGREEAPRQRHPDRHPQEVPALKHAAAIGFLALALLSGCAALPSDGTAVPATARAPAGGFTFDGRISVRQGETRYHANVTWTHTSPEDDILLTNPLGQGIARLTRDAAGARLKTADRQEWQAADWEELSARVFGHPLPLSGLPGWLRGESAGPGEGWRIDHVEYESGSRRPVLIEISREDLEVRLKIDAWEDLK